MEVLTWSKIKELYPNQWVLLGNPELRNLKINASFMSRLISGYVLLANKDKRELAYQSREVVGGYNETVCIYTGEVPKNRRFLL